MCLNVQQDGICCQWYGNDPEEEQVLSSSEAGAVRPEPVPFEDGGITRPASQKGKLQMGGRALYPPVLKMKG